VGDLGKPEPMAIDYAGLLHTLPSGAGSAVLPPSGSSHAGLLPGLPGGGGTGTMPGGSVIGGDPTGKSDVGGAKTSSSRSW
jgi:hypothetical protein